MSESTSITQVTLETKGLVKVFGRRRVVDGVDLQVSSGEVVGLLGPNGAGKTTSFYMMVGLVAATRGTVFFGGSDITSLAMYKRSRLGIGYLPQEPSVFRNLTVYDNLLAIAETLKMPRSEKKSKIERHLHELGLEGLESQKAFTLSGGERRRLEIARALVTDPQFLLMDEPFAGVDPISVAEVQTIIRKLRDQGIGILITDHNVRETLSVVDRAYLLHEGKVLVEGESEALINDPNARKFYLGDSFQL